MINTEHDNIITEETAESSSHNQSEQNSSMAAQLFAAKEQLVRATADFDNFRRRTERERIEWVTVARTTVLKRFLPITDDLERALASLPSIESTTTPAITTMIEGFMLIQKNLLKSLHDMGVEEINATGAFNPEFHEALMQIESETEKTGTIMHVFEKGYRLGDHIIRHSKVSVAK